ncbi:hypothetical protein [Mycoplasma todarodis]|uniref:hypothetical protein n=1 Tax=Mycoplasma todarodis TaxID=1937191 RepID=UPI003B2E40EA
MSEQITNFRNLTKIFLGVEIFLLILFQVMMIVFITKVFPGVKVWIGIAIGVVGVYVFGWGIFTCSMLLRKVKDENFDRKIIKHVNIIVWISLNRSMWYLALKLKKIKQG